jgi:RHS repeat-associated protein
MSEENRQLYYYHGDHLGSAQIVTDPEGKIYEQLEYTPYGELWVEHLKTTIDAMPFRFTGKERDSETGLYYFGARYLNPQTSMWLSADPAMGEYIPQAPINDEAKKHNQNLPGLGGVFNYVNRHAYHYAGNNPVKLTDPDGRADWARFAALKQQRIDDIQSGRVGTFYQNQWTTYFGFAKSFANTACAATSLLNAVARAYTLETGEAMTLEMGANLLKAAIADDGIYESTGGIRSWSIALETMAKEAGIKGQITYADNGAGSTWKIYSLFRGYEIDHETKKETTEELTHFVNYIGDGNYFDVWNSKTENLTTNGRRTTIKRPIRGINYTPPGRVYDGGMH